MRELIRMLNELRGQAMPTGRELFGGLFCVCGHSVRMHDDPQMDADVIVANPCALCECPNFTPEE